MNTDNDTVILTRAQYEALIDALEDAEDIATVRLAEAQEALIGKRKVRADYLPMELVKRLLEGEHPIRIWRQHRGLTREALAAAAGVAPSYLTEIETRRKGGSLDAVIKLAAALDVSLDDLAPWLKPHAAK
jgi:DNA-binding XRE family transcriptional regulator